MGGPVSVSRRMFLTGYSGRPARLVAPPGAAGGGLDACTGCGACVEACPTAIIVLQEGKPAIDFSAGECLFCGNCAEACPEPVFDRTVPPAFGHIAAISDDCLARSGVSCMTCRDACPQQAIRFRPRIGGPFLPEVIVTACSGCGACIAPCPTRAIGLIDRYAEAVDA